MSRKKFEISEKVPKSLITQIMTDYTDGECVENKENLCNHFLKSV
jgi:hypothetical protein